MAVFVKVQSGQVAWANGSLTTTTNQSSATVEPYGSKCSWQVNITGSGTVSVTATPQWSNDGTNWISSGSALSLTGTGSDTKGVTLDTAFKYHRINLSSITGTSATCTAFFASGAA